MIVALTINNSNKFHNQLLFIHSLLEYGNNSLNFYITDVYLIVKIIYKCKSDYDESGMYQNDVLRK